MITEAFCFQGTNESAFVHHTNSHFACFFFKIDLLFVHALQFAEEVMSLCTELAVSVFRRELNHVCQRSTGGPTNHLHNLSCRHYADLDTDVAASLAQICRAVGRLYLRHPHMRLVGNF